MILSSFVKKESTFGMLKDSEAYSTSSSDSDEERFMKRRRLWNEIASSSDRRASLSRGHHSLAIKIKKLSEAEQWKSTEDITSSFSQPTASTSRNRLGSSEFQHSRSKRPRKRHLSGVEILRERPQPTWKRKASMKIWTAASGKEWLCAEHIDYGTTKSASSLKHSLHGVIYQLKLLMVFLNRGLRKSYNFNLETEMAEAVKFDDVILNFRIITGSGVTLSQYINVIHRQDKSKTISLHDLLNETGEDFSLQKYFIYYRKIKKQLELGSSEIKDWIICTNVDFDLDDCELPKFRLKKDKNRESLLKDLAASEIDLVQVEGFDDILDSPRSKRYKLAINDRHELHEILKKSADAYALAKALAEHVFYNETMTMSSEFFKFYHVALATEVIDVEKKRFAENFTNDKNLSQGARKLREIFRVEFLKLMQSPDENITEEIIWTKIKKEILNLSSTFGSKFAPEVNPTLTNMREFSEAFAKLIRRAKNDNLIKIDRQTAYEESDEEFIEANIDKLAGHVLIVEDKQIKFRSQFTDGTVDLQGDIKEFQRLLRLQLNDDFEDLDKYRFKIENSLIWDSLCSSGCELPHDYVESEEIRDFFDKLVFSVNQPTDSELEEIIKHDIGETSNFNLLSTDLISNSFETEMLNWFKKKGKSKGKKGGCFSSQDGEAFFESIEMQVMNQICLQLSSPYLKELEEYGIEFQNETTELEDFLNDRDNRMFNVISIGETLLTAIRANSTITRTKSKRRKFVIFMRLHELLASRKMEQVISLCNSTYNYNLLVIDCGSLDSKNLREFSTVCAQLCSSIKTENDPTKLVLITNRNEESQRITSELGFKYYEEMFDEVNFNNLTEVSRKKLLNKRSIYFQETLANFRSLLGNCSYNDIVSKTSTDFGNAMDGSTLCKLIRGTTVKMGNDLKEFQEVADFYIPREFNQVYLSTDIFNCQLTSEIFVISGLDLTEVPRELMMHQEKIRSYHNIDRQTLHVYKFVILENKRETEQFKKLCAKYSSDSYNVHWLKSKSTKFIWKESRGDITNLLEYRDVDNSTASYLTEDHLAGHNGGQVVIISDGPGMGKTAMLTSLAKKIKANEPDLWVININLNSFTEVLQDEQRDQSFDVDDVDEAINCFVEKLADLETDLEKNVLKTMMKDHGRVALLFDGFDEIRPDCQQTVINLLQTFKKHGIQKLVISTRPHVTELLEKRLGVFSYTMKPFSKDHQVHFLIMWWKQRLNLDVAAQRILERVQRSAIAVIDEVAELMNDEVYECIDNPLHTKMIAKIFQRRNHNIKGEKKDFEACDEFGPSEHNKPRVMKSMIIIDLYEQVVDVNLDIYVQNRLKLSRETRQVKEMIQFLKSEWIDAHQALASQWLFKDEDLIMPKADLKIIKSANNHEMREEIEDLERVGLIDGTHDGKLFFNCRSYAGYFVANLLIDKLIMMQVSHVAHNPEVLNFILEVLLAQSYYTVRTFLNALLLKYYSSVSNQQYENNPFADGFRKSALVKNRSMSGRNILHVAVTERNAGILEYILHQFSELDETWRALITSREMHCVGYSNTPVTLAAHLGHWDELKLLLEHDRAYVNIQSNLHNLTPLHYAARSGELDMVRFLLGKGADVNAKGTTKETPLHCAASTGKLDVIEYLVGEGADVTAQNTEGGTSLHCAASTGKSDAVKYLLDKGADITARNTKGETPLHCAASTGKLHAVKYLVDKGADITARNTERETPLHCAASTGKLDVVQYLVGEGADINAQNTEGETPLHCAASTGKLDVVQYLVGEGADINAQNTEGETPLHCAAITGNLDVVRWLVKKGADLNAEGTEDKTALHYAVLAGKSVVVRWLIEHGADVDVIDTHGKTPLHYAALIGQFEMVKWLVENGSNLAAVDSHNETPLHCAASTGNSVVVEHLVDEGSDITARNTKFETPLHCAASTGKLDVVKYLVHKGADLDTKGTANKTPLHYAAALGNLEMIRWLVRMGGNTHAIDAEKKTPLHCAAITGNLDVVRWLVKKGADLNAEGTEDKTALHYAVLAGKSVVVRWLIEHGADVDVIDTHGKTPLHYAALIGQFEMVKWLVENGSNLAAVDSHNETPLHCAASTVNSVVVEHLVDEGSDITARNTKFETPLHCAASTGKLDVVKYLVHKGADLDTKGTANKTPLHYAAALGNLEMIRWLVRMGGNTHAIDAEKKTPLHCAAITGNLDVVRWLVKKGADLNAEGTEDKTALHYAVLAGKSVVVRWLIEHGADVDVIDTHGKTPLHYAALIGQFEMVKWLVENGSNLAAVDSHNETPLHCAASTGKLKVVKYLLDKGADVNAIDTRKKTPLHYAASMGHLEVMKILVKTGAHLPAERTEDKTSLHYIPAMGDSDMEKRLVEEKASSAVQSLSRIPLHEAAVSTKSDGLELSKVENETDLDFGNETNRTVLDEAASFDQLEVVKWLAQEKGVPIITEDCSKKSVMAVAVASRSWKVVKWLVEEKGATYQSDDESTVLHVAAANKEWEAVKLLAKSNTFDVNAENKAGKTVLGYAIESGNLDAIEWLVDKKHIDLNATKFKNGQTILNLAIACGDLNVVKLLVEKGADLNTKDEDGNTVVIAAASAEQWSLLEWLLDQNVFN